MTLQEIKDIEWEEVCEEDFYELKREGKLPILIYIDKHKNYYYYFRKEE